MKVYVRIILLLCLRLDIKTQKRVKHLSLRIRNSVLRNRNGLFAQDSDEHELHIYYTVSRLFCIIRNLGKEH